MSITKFSCISVSQIEISKSVWQNLCSLSHKGDPRRSVRKSKTKVEVNVEKLIRKIRDTCSYQLNSSVYFVSVELK